MSKLLAIGRALLALGGLCVLLAAGIVGWNAHLEARAGEDADAALQAIDRSFPEGSGRTGGRSWYLPKRTYYIEGSVWVDGSEYLGKLSIPALGLELPVRAEWTASGARSAPCRYTGGIGTTDLVIAGHNYRTHFGRLPELLPGDTVAFTDADGTEFIFEVYFIETIPGDDAEGMLAGSDEWDLTLFTCDRGGRNRVTVRCAYLGDNMVDGFMLA